MSDIEHNTPFQTLGRELQKIREEHRESVAEVSGAVEIDEDELERIETGTKRPSEDILMLLINHFNIREDEAVQLWEMAGYDYKTIQDSDEDEGHDDGLKQAIKSQPMLMVMALDQRVLYSDAAEINANKNGLIVTFLQTNGTQSVPIAKVGMSFQHAKNVYDILGRTLAEAERLSRPKYLPAPGTENSEGQQTNESKN